MIIAFIQSSRFKKAMVAYEKALDWQDLFDLVAREGITGDKLLDIAHRVAGVSHTCCVWLNYIMITR